MEYIRFHVFLDGVEVGCWSETNIDQLPGSLGKLVGRAKAIEYDRILRINIEVNLATEVEWKLLSPRVYWIYGSNPCGRITGISDT